MNKKYIKINQKKLNFSNLNSFLRYFFCPWLYKVVHSDTRWVGGECFSLDEEVVINTNGFTVGDYGGEKENLPKVMWMKYV